MKKIAIITNSSFACYYFRRELICDLKKADFQVCVILGDDKLKQEIERDLGIEIFVTPLVNRSKNVFSLVQYQRELMAILKKIRPDIVFTFQTKPNIFGVRAAQQLGIHHVFAMVEGLGDGFVGSSLGEKLISLYLLKEFKKSFKHIDHVFLLNDEDFNFLAKKKVLSKERATVIRGTGIDVKAYPQMPFNNMKTAMMVSRLIPRKGVIEFCEAARLCVQKDRTLHFILIGREGDITKRDLQPFLDDGSIEYLGNINDLHPYLANMTIAVVPTYYLEGLPRAIMEAMATGRPVITTNVRGCNACVTNLETGLIVKQQDANDLSEKILWLFHHQDVLKDMGEKARSFACKFLSSETIDNTVIQIIKSDMD